MWHFWTKWDVVLDILLERGDVLGRGDRRPAVHAVTDDAEAHKATPVIFPLEIRPYFFEDVIELGPERLRVRPSCAVVDVNCESDLTCDP